MTPDVSRAVALVAFGLGLAAIWIDFGGGSSYWDSPGHSIGIAMLVLGIVAGLGVVAALLLRHPAFDRIWMLAGLPLGGLLLFIPVDIFGEGSTGELDSGAWLGFTSFCLFVVAAALNALSARWPAVATTTYAAPATAPPRPPPADPPPPP